MLLADLFSDVSVLSFGETTQGFDKDIAEFVSLSPLPLLGGFAWGWRSLWLGIF